PRPPPPRPPEDVPPGPGRGRRPPARAPGRAGRPARAQRRRQDHHPADVPGRGRAGRRHDRDRRPPAARGAQRGHGPPRLRRRLPGPARAGESLRMFGQLYGLADPEGQARRGLERFEIPHLARAMGTELSSGQKTLVGIVKSPLHDPELLVLDEPTASLDPDVALRVRTGLAALCDERGTALLGTSPKMVGGGGLPGPRAGWSPPARRWRWPPASAATTWRRSSCTWPPRARPASTPRGCGHDLPGVPGPGAGPGVAGAGRMAAHLGGGPAPRLRPAAQPAP